MALTTATVAAPATTPPAAASAAVATSPRTTSTSEPRLRTGRRLTLAESSAAASELSSSTACASRTSSAISRILPTLRSDPPRASSRLRLPRAPRGQAGPHLPPLRHACEGPAPLPEVRQAQLGGPAGHARREALAGHGRPGLAE